MALPSTIRLRFVTPERELVHGDVDEVQLPGDDGYFGVLPGHAPLLAALRAGQLWFRKGNVREYAFVSGGFAEVLPDSVSVLSQVGERAEDIDVARAEASKRRAEEVLARPAPATTDIDIEAERQSLRRAELRLQISERARQRG